MEFDAALHAAETAVEENTPEAWCDAFEAALQHGASCACEHRLASLLGTLAYRRREAVVSAADGSQVVASHRDISVPPAAMALASLEALWDPEQADDVHESITPDKVMQLCEKDAEHSVNLWISCRPPAEGPSEAWLEFVTNTVQIMQNEPVPQIRKDRLQEWRALAGPNLDAVSHVASRLQETQGFNMMERMVGIKPVGVDGSWVALEKRLQMVRSSWTRPLAAHLPFLLLDPSQASASVLLPNDTVLANVPLKEGLALLLQDLFERGGGKISQFRSIKST